MNNTLTALLDLQSTSQGLLVPRMTTAQRTAIATPANALLLFDTTLNNLQIYKSSAWNYPGANALFIQGVTISATAPLSTQALVYSGTQWAPATISGGSGTQIPMVELQVGGTQSFLSNFTPTPQNSYFEITIAGSLTTNNSSYWDNPSNARLRWLGANTQLCHFRCCLSVRSNRAGDTYFFAFGKNGTAITTKVHGFDFTTNGVTATHTFHNLISMSTNDYVSCYINDISDNDAKIGLQSMTFIASAGALS